MKFVIETGKISNANARSFIQLVLGLGMVVAVAMYAWLLLEGRSMWLSGFLAFGANLVSAVVFGLVLLLFIRLRRAAYRRNHQKISN
jgi:hypothetical protein